MNVSKMAMNNGANLSMFMMNVSVKLLAPLRLAHAKFSSLDFKTRYREVKCLDETLKGLPQKPEVIVIDEITERFGSIGTIHQTLREIKPRYIGESIVKGETQ